MNKNIFIVDIFARVAHQRQQNVGGLWQNQNTGIVPWQYYPNELRVNK
jgi:hypothetical protein